MATISLECDLKSELNIFFPLLVSNTDSTYMVMTSPQQPHRLLHQVKAPRMALLQGGFQEELDVAGPESFSPPLSEPDNPQDVQRHQVG